jgi:integrase
MTVPPPETADRTLPPASHRVRASDPPRRTPPAAETLRLYRADWGAFASWCDAERLAALPADPATVARFLAASVPSVSAGALARRAAAIADRHRQNGLISPASDPVVTALLRHTRRTATPRRPASPRPAQLARMAAACPPDLAGLRDRAVLLLAGTSLGRAGLRRVALVGLQVEQLRFTARGLELTLPGDDRTGHPPRVLVVPRGERPGGCPVQGLRDWLQASATLFGPVFRKVDRWGNVEHRPLGTDAVRRIVARRTPRRSRRSRATPA